MRTSNIRQDEYLTVDQESSHQIRVKGSQFHGLLAPCQRAGDAEEMLQNIRKKYFDATHHCYAFRIDDQNFRYSDAGEPTGTAGRPILSMIDKHHLYRVILVVSRYFGGTKLGTGGLLRAYGNCARLTINQAKIINRLNYQTIKVEYSFEHIHTVQHLAKRFRARVREDATVNGMKAEVDILPSTEMIFCQELINNSAGGIRILSKKN